MSWSAVVWFLVGMVIGQITLAVSLALTRGPGREADEHEEGGV